MLQIYLNKDRKASEALLEKVTKLGASAIMFTVDAAWRSKRTRDVRAKTTTQVCPDYQPCRSQLNEARHRSKMVLGVRPRRHWESVRRSRGIKIPISLGMISVLSG